MILSKDTLYDWHGGNVALFKTVNHLSGNDLYDAAMIFLTRLGDHHNFMLYMGILLAVAAFDTVARTLYHKGGTRHHAVAWMSVLLVLAGSYAADGMAVKELKEHFAYPRPYIALSSHDVHLIDEKKSDDDYHSFPSGHASFITVMVIGLWPILPAALRCLGVFLIAGVCWSRLAVGMHFPADVLSGFLLSLVITLIVRWIVVGILHRLSGVWT